MSSRLLGTAAAVLFAASAQAQTPEQIERIRLDEAYAQGQRLLAAAGAEDLFVNEARAPGPGAVALKLRHKASGFLCVFNPDRPRNKISVGPSPRGDDVLCVVDTAADVRILRLRRAGPDDTAESLARSAAEEIEKRWPGARRRSLAPDERPAFARLQGASATTNLPQSWSAKYLTDESYERVTVGVKDGWAVSYRFTARPETAEQDQRFDLYWPTTVMEPTVKAPPS